MKNLLDINERISYLIKSQYNDNQKKFAESINYSAQVVFNIVSGRKTKPSYDVLSAIVSTNDDISSEWLLTGKGSMMKNQADPIPSDAGNYKELADARLDIIDGLKFKVKTLEKELSELKDVRQGSFLYSSVAEPAPELVEKSRK